MLSLAALSYCTGGSSGDGSGTDWRFAAADADPILQPVGHTLWRYRPTEMSCGSRLTGDMVVVVAVWDFGDRVVYGGVK